VSLSLKLFCMLIALALFAIAAVGIGTGRFSLIAGGLFFVTAGETFG
jgi:hypothetical protein